MANVCVRVCRCLLELGSFNAVFNSSIQMFSRSVGADKLLIVRKKNEIPASRRHSSTLHMRFGSKYFWLDWSAGNAHTARIHTATKHGVNFYLSFPLSCLVVLKSPAKLGTPPFKTRQTPQGERLEYQSYLRNAGQFVLCIVYCVHSAVRNYPGRTFDSARRSLTQKLKSKRHSDLPYSVVRPELNNGVQGTRET